MWMVIQALIPVFGLIVMGHLMRRWQFPAEDFWVHAERLTYYVLFPAMLVYKLGSAELAASAYGEVLLLIAVMVLAMTLVLVGVWFICRWPGAVYSSVFQGAIRFNSYVALAAAGTLLGDKGFSVMAIAVAIMVPILNFLSILMFSATCRQGPMRWAPVVRSVLTNPLILGSLTGVLWSYFRIGFHPVLAGLLSPLSDLALPLGLMTVGAGLQLGALRSASTPFLVASAAKLLGFPLMTAALVVLLGVDEPLARVAILLSALPTASAAYILARQMGGDAPLMAAIVSGQTLLAMLTIPVVLALFW